jgi:hypothetical protein
VSYRLKDDITREQIQALVDALNPFYGIGSALGVTQGKDGIACTRLYDGQSKPTLPEDEDCEQQIENLSDDACLFGATGIVRGLPASFMAPVIKAKHFFAAREAFLACIEADEKRD